MPIGKWEILKNGVLIASSEQNTIENKLLEAIFFGDIPVTLDEYQELAVSTAIYSSTDLYKDDPYFGQVYCAMQLAAEAGEVSGKYAKAIRKGEKEVNKEAVIKELGDTLWYIANLAGELGITLNEVAQINIDKLQDRKERGVLHGDGDNR